MRCSRCFGLVGQALLVGMAFTPVAADAATPLFGVSTGATEFDVIDNVLLSIDPLTGSATAIGDITGYDTINGLAYDPNSDTLYAVNSGLNVQDPDGDVLLTLDPLTAAPTLIGQLETSLVNGLTFDPNTNTLYGVESVNDSLLTIDTTSGLATPVGDTGFEAVNGLTFDPNTGTLYGVDNSADVLITIDPNTGGGTEVGPLTLGGLRGVTFDANSAQLFGVDNLSDELVSINTLTGTATGIGPLGFDNVTALTAVPEPATLGLIGAGGLLVMRQRR